MAWVSLGFLSTVSLILHRSITWDSACAGPIHGSTGEFGVVAVYNTVRLERQALTTRVSTANRLIFVYSSMMMIEVKHFPFFGLRFDGSFRGMSP